MSVKQYSCAGGRVGFPGDLNHILSDSSYICYDVNHPYKLTYFSVSCTETGRPGMAVVVEPCQSSILGPWGPQL